MNKVIKYLGHPLHTVAAKERDRQRIAEAMAQFGPIEPAKEFVTTPTPAERRVASWKKDECSSKTSLFTA